MLSKGMGVSESLNLSRYRFAWVALVLCISACHCWGLDPGKTVFQYNCRTWTRQSGLPGDGINAIAQTADGYLWLGTAEGLVSFDGVEFTPRGKVELPSLIVTSLASSHDGGLWVGLEHGSFAYCDGRKVTFKGKDEWGGTHLNVHSILETRDHALWLAADVRTARLSLERHWQTIASNDTTTLMEDSKGRVWFGTSHHGLFWWEKGVLNQFPDHIVDAQDIRALAEDRDGRLWIGTDLGPLCYDTNFLRKDLPFPWYPVHALLVDREGTLWGGTLGHGLIRYQHGAISVFGKQDGLADDYVFALAEDQEGNLWVGTRNGLSQFSDVKIPTFTKTEGLPGGIITDVCASRSGGLWLATDRGFTSFDGRGRSSTTLLGLSNEYVNRVFEAKNGDIYLINAFKEVEIFRGSNVLARYGNNDWPTAMGEDAKSVVVAVGQKLFRVGTNFFSPIQVAGGHNPDLGWVYNITTGRDGCLWLATSIAVCSIKNGVCQLWPNKDGFRGGRATWICEGSEGEVWVGSDQGLARIKNGVVIPVNVDQGLFDNVIYSAIPDNHNCLWVDSSRGFFSLDTRSFDDFARHKTRHVNCVAYTGLNGVKSAERFSQKEAGCKSRDGRLWFPTAQGLAMIDPDNINPRSLAPRVYIQSTRADGKEMKSGETSAPPGKGGLEFQYAGLDYIAPQRIHYRYMLQGYEEEWVDAGTRRSAFFTNLKPGHYRFLVQACNEDGVWSAAPASVEVELQPHYYQSTWFIFLSVAGIIASLLAIYAWRLNHLTRKQQQLQKDRDLLEAKVQERTLKLREEIEERKRIQAEVEQVHRELVDASRRAGQAEVATNVLHNVGNVLNSINVGATLVDERVRNSRVADLGLLVNLIQEHDQDRTEFLTRDPRGRKVPEFLSLLSSVLASDQKEMLAELASLRRNVQHVKEIIAMQQGFARVSAVYEKIRVAELLEDTLRMHEASLARRDVKVVREFNPLPPICTDKHKVLQILINLVRNAEFACEESGRSDKQLTLRATNGEGRVRIAVIDNGVGIPAENLIRIFHHGFTTRKDGHGFGLHSGALAAKELGGALTVSSPGRGLGAVFTLELPCQPPSSHDSANPQARTQNIAAAS